MIDAGITAATLEHTRAHIAVSGSTRCWKANKWQPRLAR
ncbi:hypothetical protein I552_6382 [Mycobacterium xenopi 3993]|nr:hypothetical protein I552_6382 [Mycobacterium xenopi 3993]